MTKAPVQFISDNDAESGQSDGSVSALYRRAGAFVFVSGNGHIQPGKTDQANAGGGIRQQTAACIEGLLKVLEHAGGGLENLVEMTTYLANMNDYNGYNEIYSKYFTPDGPARTTIAVHQLSHPGSLIEIRGTAYIAEGNTNEG